jgi:hypothetical protein
MIKNGNEKKIKKIYNNFFEKVEKLEKKINKDEIHK